MSLIQVIRTELYKNSHRKSSMMLFIPMLLALLITFGYSCGMIKLNLTIGSMEAYSCMDFVFIIWNVLSGLGIMGILLILFAALQFSGEIERGQIKMMLLRIGKRETVVAGKYLSAIIVAIGAIIGVFLVSAASYYIMIARTSMGTGAFAATITGMSTRDIFAALGLQILMYFILISITFFAGLFVNPFITFIVAIVFMYAANYLSGMTNMVSKLLPSYWSNQIMTGGEVQVIQIVISIGFTATAILLILIVVMKIFGKQDVK